MKNKKVLISLLSFSFVAVFVLAFSFVVAKEKGQNERNGKVEGREVEVRDEKKSLEVDAKKESQVSIKTQSNKDDTAELSEDIADDNLTKNEDKVQEKKNMNVGEYSGEIKKTTAKLKEISEKASDGVLFVVGDIVNEQEMNQVSIDQSVEAIENRSKVKTFLFGSDYKNLGQLRSQLVQNRNQIKRLEGALNGVFSDGERVAIEKQIALLNGQEEKINQLIIENENEFSLFGWVSKWIAGYKSESVVDTESVTNDGASGDDGNMIDGVELGDVVPETNQ